MGRKIEIFFSIFLVIKKLWSIDPIRLGIASFHPNWCHPFGENYTASLIWFQHVPICFFLYFQSKKADFHMFRVDVPNIFSSGTDNSMDAGTQRKNSGQTNFVLETWWEKFRRSRVPNFFRSELGQDFREILEELGLKKPDSLNHSP